MDYTVFVLNSNGETDKIECATDTDVENIIFGLIRGSVSNNEIKMISFVVNFNTRLSEYK